MQYAISHRASVSNEIEFLLADGRRLYVQNDVEPLYDTHGDIYGCVSVVVDMTDRKLAEMALREADRRKDEFLATLSHELRNPLAPIRTALEVMRLADHDPRGREQGQRNDGAPADAPGADHRRSARRGADHAQHRRAAPGTHRSARRAAERIESTRPMLDARAQALDVGCRPRRSGWMPT